MSSVDVYGYEKMYKLNGTLPVNIQVINHGLSNTYPTLGSIWYVLEVY